LPYDPLWSPHHDTLAPRGAFPHRIKRPLSTLILDESKGLYSVIASSGPAMSPSTGRSSDLRVACVLTMMGRHWNYAVLQRTGKHTVPGIVSAACQASRVMIMNLRRSVHGLLTIEPQENIKTWLSRSFIYQLRTDHTGHDVTGAIAPYQTLGDRRQRSFYQENNTVLLASAFPLYNKKKGVAFFKRGTSFAGGTYAQRNLMFLTAFLPPEIVTHGRHDLPSVQQVE